jgi:transcriptional regulator with XRE-family HTH domain
MNDRERIELLMKCYNLSPSQFADRAGVQRASISHILSGRNKPSLEVLLKIFEAFPGLDMQWLMTGKGVAPVESGQQDVLAVPARPVAAVQSELFTAFRPAVQSEVVAETPSQKVVQPRPVSVERAPRRSSRAATQAATGAAQVAVVKRIKEIRVYYTDGTYEVLCPEK